MIAFYPRCHRRPVAGTMDTASGQVLVCWEGAPKLEHADFMRFITAMIEVERLERLERCRLWK